MGAVSENLKLLGEYSARMEEGDEQAVYDFFAPEFRSQATDRVNPALSGTDIRGEEIKFWNQARSAFPDMTFDVNVLVEQDDLVVTNWTITGTHTGTAFYDVPPSGDAVRIDGTAILKLRDGMIVEHWGGPHCQNGVGLVAT
jgi:predicted ester cyclase